MGQPKFDVIRQLAISLLKRNTLHDLCWEIAHAIGSLPGFEDSVVYLLKDGSLVQTAAYGQKATPERHIVNPLAIPVGAGIVGHVAATGKPQLIDDTAADPRYIRDEYAGRSELSVPVIYQDRVIAVLDSEHALPGAYTQQHLEILEAMANVCAPRIASAQVEESNAKVREELQQLNSQLEERVQRRTAQLEAARDTSETQRDRLRTVLNSIQNGLIVLDNNRDVSLLSPSAAGLLCVDPQNVMGVKIDTILRLQEAENVQTGIDRLIRSGRTEDATLVLPNDSIREIRWNVSALDNDECVIVLSDVTDHRLLTRQTQQLDRMQSLGVLAGGIAHDFNNNLAAIEASLACIHPVAGSTDERAIDVARQASTAAAQLTKQLMTYAKGGQPVRAACELSGMLDLAIDLATSGSRTEVECRIDKDLPPVNVDSGQMTQVFSNVILNAVQAMPGGGVIRIAATKETKSEAANGLSRKGQFVRISISDQGPGFDEGELPRVFEPYYSKRSDGHGLGLTTCFFVVDSHGGHIDANNTRSGGAVITILLPVAHGPASVPLTESKTTSARPRTILVLDDEEVVRSSVTMMLQMEGHTVISAATGEQALQFVAEKDCTDVEIALLDLTVRGGSGGLEIVSQLQSGPHRIFCIAMSGYSDRHVMSEPERFGFQGVLPKPFTREQICRLINDVPT